MLMLSAIASSAVLLSVFAAPQLAQHATQNHSDNFVTVASNYSASPAQNQIQRNRANRDARLARRAKNRAGLRELHVRRMQLNDRQIVRRNEELDTQADRARRRSISFRR